MTLKQIQQQLDEAQSLQLITHALSDLSSMRLKKIRDGVQRNAFFFAEISKVYHIVKRVAFLRKVSVPKNGKTLSIVITSNFRFYGNLNTNLLKYFLDQTQTINTDTVVIGTTGIEYLKGVYFTRAFQPVVLKKDMPTDEELKELVNVVKDYSQVFVFHSQFKTVLTQIPTFKDITQTSDFDDRGSRVANRGSQSERDTSKMGGSAINDKQNSNFIFEPEIEKTLVFFDSQLTTLLLEETFLESELARVAARLISTSQAEKAAEQFLEDKKKLFANARRTSTNTRLLESLSSFSAIKGKGV